MPTLRKVAVLLLLAVLLVAPWASAAGPRSSPRPANTEASAQAFLSRAWAFLTNVWTKTGCHIDPNGRCLIDPAPSPTNQADTGCNIDPSGLCHS